MIKIRKSRKDMEAIEKEHLKLASLIHGRIQEQKALNKDYSQVYELIADALEEILIGQPVRLEKLSAKIENECNRIEINWRNTALFDSLSKIFNYEHFCDRKKIKWDAFKLATHLDCKVCPYCNRIPITTVDSSVKSLRPDFDHFLSKARYPYLALSLYNLIPCCTICNSRTKGAIEFKSKDNIHPYLSGYENTMKFILKLGYEPGDSFVKSHYLATIKEFSVEYQLDMARLSTQSKIKNNMEVFRLIDLYNKHRVEISSLIDKAQSYDEDLMTQLFKKKKLNSKSSKFKHLFGTYWEIDKFGLVPLSKLNRDIFIFWSNLP